MRAFLEKHSSLYRWAIRPTAAVAELWRRMYEIESDAHDATVADMDEAAKAMRATHEDDLRALDRIHDESLAFTQGRLEDAKEANARLRSMNRRLVARIRDIGFIEEEAPLTACDGCGALVAEGGPRHRSGTSIYDGMAFAHYCDGTEEPV